MLRSLRLAAPAVQRHCSRGLATEIPVASVARVMRMSVGDEATAMKADAMMKDEVLPLVAAQKGYVKMIRTVCKTEWAYEVSFVFDSFDNFKAAMESPATEAVREKYLPAVLKLATAPDDLYRGNRVYDEW